ncbi:hypothetical protein D3C73_1127220 [compost metagenome]
MLHVLARGGAGDPLRAAVSHRSTAVQAGRQLHPQPRTTALHARQEALVEFARLRGHQALGDLDAGFAQQVETTAIDLREWVAHRRNNARHAGVDQRQCARRRASVMRARFQSDVGGGTTRFGAGLAQGEHFGMRATGSLVPALPDHALAMGDHAADHRVGAGGIGGTLGEPQRASHVQVVKDGERCAHAAMVAPLVWIHAMRG